MAAADLVEYVAKSLVDDPEAVKVEVVQDQGQRPRDVGRTEPAAHRRLRRQPTRAEVAGPVGSVTGPRGRPVVDHGPEVDHQDPGVAEGDLGMADPLTGGRYDRVESRPQLAFHDAPPCEVKPHTAIMDASCSHYHTSTRDE